MPGQVFLSYGRTDRGAAFRVAQRLDAEGFSVWWDPKIAPGVTYDRVIERALAGGYDTTVRIWDLRGAKEIDRLEGSSEWILSLAVTPDGTLAIAGTSGGELLVWDLTTGELVAQLAIHQGPVMSLDFKADAGLLSGSADKTVNLLSRAPLR